MPPGKGRVRLSDTASDQFLLLLLRVKRVNGAKLDKWGVNQCIEMGVVVV